MSGKKTKRGRGNNHAIYDDPLLLYSAMIRDIVRAKKSILIEMYMYDSDIIGERFRDALVKKAKQGIQVKILLDAFGSSATEGFFRPLKDAGGEVKFFKKIKVKLNFFSYNHNRDHRKIVIIDERIGYVGSTNITSECINWRELTIRFTGKICLSLKQAFYELYHKHKKRMSVWKQTYPIKHENFEIVRDVPSFISQRIKSKCIKMINSAKKEVIIETPYFVPDSYLRKALKKACRRGVDVRLLFPLRSDVRTVDILREAYLGRLYKRGVKILFYVPKIMHAKAMLVDGESFIVGSSNFDYRSFIHQYELCVVGTDRRIIRQLQAHFQETQEESSLFNYEKWKKRHFLQKLMETILYPFKQFI